MRSVVTCVLSMIIGTGCGASPASQPDTTTSERAVAPTGPSLDRVYLEQDVPLFRDERAQLVAALQMQNYHAQYAACRLGTCEVVDGDVSTLVFVDKRRAAEIAAWLDAARALPRAVRARGNGPVPAAPPRGPCRDSEPVKRGAGEVTVASHGDWADDPACTPIARTLISSADALLACRELAPAVIEVQRDGQLGRCEGPTCTCALLSLSHVAFAPAVGARRLVLHYSTTRGR